MGINIRGLGGTAPLRTPQEAVIEIKHVRDRYEETMLDPLSTEDLTAWLQARFKEKQDELLKQLLGHLDGKNISQLLRVLDGRGTPNVEVRSEQPLPEKQPTGEAPHPTTKGSRGRPRLVPSPKV